MSLLCRLPVLLQVVLSGISVDSDVLAIVWRELIVDTRGREFLLHRGHVTRVVLTVDGRLGQRWGWHSLLYPWFFLDLLKVQALCWVYRQEALYYLYGLYRQERRYLIVALQDLLVKQCCLCLLEWQVAARHRIQDDSTRPDVAAEAVVAFSGDHFGCGVAGTTTSCF